MQTQEAKLKVVERIALDLDAKLPLRIWVEGDGEIYGEFQGNNAQRVPLTVFDAIKLIHAAGSAARRLISI